MPRLRYSWQPRRRVDNDDFLTMRDEFARHGLRLDVDSQTRLYETMPNGEAIQFATLERAKEWLDFTWLASFEALQQD